MLLCNSYSAGERVFLDVLDRKFWTQHVDFPTHKEGNTLDLSTSSSPDLVSGVRSDGYLGSGDHTMVWVDMVGPARDQVSVEMVPDWRNAKMEDMEKALGEINWEEKLEGKKGVECWDIFREVLNEETERCIPKK